MPIHVLDSQLISQIAAGEVVERPASIVKELLENSLDAGAQSVTLELEAGGLRLIRVRDDGHGIDSRELPLALSRHATSKIDSLDALERVATLGFRGEALPSIASVSDLSLTSRSTDSEAAYAVSGCGDDQPPQPRPAAHPPGTTVEVRDLFARVPARRKFLRTEATEFRHARQTFNRIALSRFDVAFRLRHNSREIVHLPVSDSADAAQHRIARICSQDFMAHALRIDDTAAGMRLSGWIANPGFSRSQADLQYSFVNGRMIRDKLFNHAVRQAYHDVLHNRRFPAFVLYLTLDPAQVDVNAHPAKAEVRFRQSRLVHDFVFRSLHAMLEHQYDDAAGHRVELPVTHVATPSGPPATPFPQGRASRPLPLGEPRALTRPVPLSESAAAYRFQAPNDSPATQQRATGGQHAPPMGYALAQLHGIYILAENTDGLIVVDMHAAHERVLYERMKKALDNGTLVTQPLLVPITLSVDEPTAELAQDNTADLAELGLEVDRSGPSQVTLRALPSLLGEVDGEALLRDVLADLAAEQGAQRVRQAMDQLLGDMGCRAAIKAGRQLTIAEMNALLRDMEGTARAGHCNHGRPSWVQVDMQNLDRMFMRGK